MAESDSQRKPMTYAIEALDAHFRDRSDVYVSGNLLLYHEEGNNKVRVAPDTFVVFRAAKHDRSSYLLWREGKAPDFVLEIASESTWRLDLGKKRDTYADLGVSEYWLYDPTGNCFAPRLQGFRLAGGRYEPLPVRDGDTLTGHSEVLGLELRLYPAGRFRFHDPVASQDLLSLEEAEGGRGAEAQARHVAEARLQESEAARKALEAELQELRRGNRGRAQEAG